MKQNKYLVLTAAVTMTLASCGDTKNKQEAEFSTPKVVEQAKEQTSHVAVATFSDGMIRKVFQNYQKIRTALVNSDADKVKKAAENFAESFSDERKDMKTMALAMAKTDDLVIQRELFSEFTEKLEPMFKESITGGTIYKQFCPMAFEGKGGYWISNVDEIRNPYYGDKMLKCGKVVAKIQ